MRYISKIVASVLLVCMLLMLLPVSAEAAETKVNLSSMHTEKSSYYEVVTSEDGITDSYGNNYKSNIVKFDASESGYARYDLNGAYTSFTGTIVASDRTGSGASINVGIFADGKKVYSLTDYRRQGMLSMSGIGGSYASEGYRAASALRGSLGSLAQAAQILGSNVSMGNLSQSSSGARSTVETADSSVNSGRNLYEAAAAQRAGDVSGTSGRAGAQHMLGASRPMGRNRLSIATYTEEPETHKPRKSGGLGQKISSVKNKILNHIQGTQSFSGFPVRRNPYKKGSWDVVGGGYDAYCAYRDNIDNYTYSTSGYGQSIVCEIDINMIEGIPYISDAELKDPQIFWGRESGKNMESFLMIASRIPDVKEKLHEGVDIHTLLMDPELGSCAAIYFCPDSPGAPTVTKGNGFYEFGSNGRHRILAARHFGYSFPMRITGEIVRKNDTNAAEPVKGNAIRRGKGTGMMGAKPSNRRVSSGGISTGIRQQSTSASPAASAMADYQTPYEKASYSAMLTFKNPDTDMKETVQINRTVYENRNIDPHLKIPKGTRYANGKKTRENLSNLELMQMGKAPFICTADANGNEIFVPVELHHLSGRETVTGAKYFTGAEKDGGIVEIASTLHDKYSRVLHLGSPSFRKGVAGKKSRDSVKYTAFRKQYWKDRATKILADCKR